MNAMKAGMQLAKNSEWNHGSINHHNYGGATDGDIQGVESCLHKIIAFCHEQ